MTVLPPVDSGQLLDRVHLQRVHRCWQETKFTVQTRAVAPADRRLFDSARTTPSLQPTRVEVGCQETQPTGVCSTQRAPPQASNQPESKSAAKKHSRPASVRLGRTTPSLQPTRVEVGPRNTADRRLFDSARPPQASNQPESKSVQETQPTGVCSTRRNPPQASNQPESKSVSNNYRAAVA